MVALFKAYRVTGVVGFLIALLIAQIFIVIRFGVEPKKKGLEEIDPELPVEALDPQM